MNENKKINFELIISLTMIMITTLGSTIFLYIHSDNKIDAYRMENTQNILAMREEVKAIQQEMKDFHGRLISIEERNRNDGKY